jgi:hypothetical protein
MFVKDQRVAGPSKVFNARRRDARYVSSVPVTLHRYLRFGPFITRGMCLDVSMKGMSALVCGAPRVGETVVIELPLGEICIEALATVRHNTNSNSGFEFYPLSPDDHAGLYHWICELRRDEELLFPRAYMGAFNVGGG